MVASRVDAAPLSFMRLTTTPERAEQRLIGQTLRALRERKRWTQADIAAPLKMTTQAWQKYEAGERRFSDERLAHVLEILEATSADFEFERARILGTPPRPTTPPPVSTRRAPLSVYGKAHSAERGLDAYDMTEALRTFDVNLALGTRSDAIQIAGDSMTPWVEPGQLVIFDRDSYPRRGAGCVVELDSGEAFVRIYERSDGSTIFLRELHPEPRLVSYPLATVRGVYAVKFRTD